MRLHRLRIRAFGPFAGEECVDVDRLGEGGLFLLHGPTGAGKTSVLDAVCFALYGRVPGERARVLGGLRSDHADPVVAPEVSCTFSVGARRFEITRSPQWERPKKRGAGTVTEQARVVLTEWTDVPEGGDPVTLTTRLDEAGDLIQQVLGLGLEHFTKLILLPQGEFAAFLRADAETRKRLLERLFGTDRFTAVQKWLGERRTDLGRDVAEAERLTHALLARADQAMAPLSLPTEALADLDDPLDHAPGRAPGDGSDTGASPADTSPSPAETDPLARVTDLARRATTIRNAARQDRVLAADRLHQARARSTAASDLARRQQLHTALRRRQTAFEAEAAGRARWAEQLTAAAHARTVAPLVTRCLEAREAVRVAEVHLAALEPAAGRRPHPSDHHLTDHHLTDHHLTDHDLTEHIDRLTRTLGDLESVEADAARLDGLGDTLATLESVVSAGRGAVTATRDRVERDILEHADVVRRLGEARVTAAPLDALVTQLDRIRAQSEAAELRDRLLPEVSAAAELVATTRTALQDARETWLALRESRLEGMAAELAHALVSGEPCRVCGSAEHPVPARTEAESVTEADEAVARAAVDVADTAHTAAAHQHALLTSKLAVAEAAAGGLDVAAARSAVTATRAALAAARTAVTEAERLERTRDGLDERLRIARQELSDLERRLEDGRPELERVRAEASQLADRVDRARGDHPSVAARRTAIEADLERHRRIVDVRTALTRARDRVDEVEPAARAAAAEAGFADLESATAAILDEAATVALRDRIAEHDRERAAVQDRLADPELLEAARHPAADVDAAAAEREVAERADEAAARRLALAESSAEELTGLVAELGRHLEAVRPLQAEHARVDTLARCADGLGPENEKRMSLSSYVLAARLEQVATAAGERLARMSGGRYTLVHTDQKERGGARSGLGLRVVDGWTGRRRDTATLSGGETFYASLALALGLADVVTQESGGMSLETLFIDEGFGSLDEDTLDEVMDVLDDLRNGGRTVGLVSHVVDLRRRLPHRLEVRKGRDGSHLVQTDPPDGGGVSPR